MPSQFQPSNPTTPITSTNVSWVNTSTAIPETYAILTDGNNLVALASGVPAADAIGLVVRTAGPQQIEGTVTVSGVNGITVEVSGLTNLSINNFPVNQQVFGSVTISGDPQVQVSNFPDVQVVAGIVTISGVPDVIVDNFPINQNVTIVSPLGYRTMDQSVSVTMASDQHDILVKINGDDIGQGGTQNANVVDWDATRFGGLGISDGEVVGLATTSSLWGTDKTSGNTFPVLVDKSLTKSTKGAPLVTTLVGVVALSGNSTIAVSNFPAIQTIQGTVNVSGVVVEIGTVNVSGLNNVGINNFPANQQVFGSVTLSGSPIVMVSGLNFNADGDLLVDIDSFPADTLVSGNITTNGQTVVMTPQSSTGAIAIQTTGTWTGNLQIEATLDGTNWFSRKGQTSNTSTQVITQNGIIVIAGDAYYQIRVRANSSITGTCFVNMRDGIGTQVISIADSLPPGSNTLGSIILTDGTHTANIDNNGNLDVHISGWFGSSAPTVGQKTSANSIPVTISSDQTAINIIPPPLTVVTGMVGISGNPQIIAGPLPGATYPVNGAVAVSGNVIVQQATGIGTGGVDSQPFTVKISAISTAVAGGQSLPIQGTVNISGTPSVLVSNFPATQNVNIVGYPNPLNIQGSVSLSGNNNITVNIPPVLEVTGMVGISGNPQVVAGPLPGAIYPVAGAITLSGTPGINIAQWIGSTAPTVGSKTSANSLPVVIASDQAAINIMPPPLTMVTGIIGLSGNPLVQAGPLAGATYPVTGAVTLSGNPAITYATPTTDAYSEASINFSSASDNVIVSGFGAQTIRVFRIFFVSNGTNNITLKYGATAANQTGPMNYVAGSTFVLDASPNPWFTSVAGSGFIMNGSTSQQVVGRLYYTQS